MSKQKNTVRVVRTLHGLSHKAAVAEAMNARVEIARLMNELHAAKERNLVAVKELAEELIATRLETGEYVTKEQLRQAEEVANVYQRCFEDHADTVTRLELEKLEPIPMRITCPDCGELHIDEGEFATKVHHTHSCQRCGLTWRPAVRATVGVRFLPGFTNDTSTSPAWVAEHRGKNGTGWRRVALFPNDSGIAEKERT